MSSLAGVSIIADAKRDGDDYMSIYEEMKKMAREKVVWPKIAIMYEDEFLPAFKKGTKHLTSKKASEMKDNYDDELDALIEEMRRRK